MVSARLTAQVELRARSAVPTASLSEYARLAARSKMGDHVLTIGAESQPLKLVNKDHHEPSIQ